MRVTCNQIVAVINLYHITILRMEVRVDHDASSCSNDWRSLLRHKINSFMKCTLPGEGVDTPAEI